MRCEPRWGFLSYIHLVNKHISQLLVVTLGLLTLVRSSAGQLPSADHWKAFSNRAGWSMSFPSGWSLASCHNCSDVKAADVFVDFFPPRHKTNEGWVMVRPLLDMPKNSTLNAFFADVSSSANQCRHLREEALELNGLPAFKVRYQTADGGEMEEVYVVAGSKTYSITFSDDSSHRPVEQLANYAIYLRMLNSFSAERH